MPGGAAVLEAVPRAPTLMLAEREVESGACATSGDGPVASTCLQERLSTD